MFTRILYPFAALVLFFSNTQAQQPPLQRQAIILKRVIEKNHYNPRPVNDAFSTELFDRVIKRLDEYKLYLTQQDISSLSAAYRTQLDEELEGKSWGFTTALAKLYKARLLRADTIRNRLLDKPVTFDSNEFFTYGDSQPPAQDEAEYQLRMARYVKWLVLRGTIDALEADSTPITKASILKQEPAERKKLKEVYRRKLEGQLKPDAITKMVDGIYLATIANGFDPHTDFFPPEEKEDFEDQLSSRSMEYGFSLGEGENGEIKIASLVPGGAAWKSGNIHNDDVLIQIKPEGAPVIDVKNSSEEEIASVLTQHENKKIEVTVKSADGTVKNIALQKEERQNDENMVKGFVLNGSKKIGYISLPSFYTNWGDNNSTSCANDVAKEIVKLKKENIDGLILDLRYNGGGSVQEAVELSGIFIDIGPMSLIKAKGSPAYIMKDPNRGTIYDGPMVLMINGQSASASELVAGTLQDFKRATIVGSTSFGKATMQVVLPLDTSINYTDRQVAESPQGKELGFAKTTVGKLFRITCKTAQLNGVVPDVPLPDAFEAMEYTERSLPNALPSDTVMKNVVYTPLPAAPVETLRQQSQQRVASQPYFSKLQPVISAIKTMRSQHKTPLQWEAYLKWSQQADLPEMPADKPASKVFSVANPAFDNAVINIDTYQKEMNDYVMKDLAGDPYIEETFQIMLDIIHSPK
jgi:carboxyl-terminal processing protease